MNVAQFMLRLDSRDTSLGGCWVYENLDDAELLRAALEAMQSERSADAVSLLKLLLERAPQHPYGHYLLAAEHMQLGLTDRAEEGFLRAVALAPDFPIARFQLGQLYLVKGDSASMRATLGPLADLPLNIAIASFAKGLMALGDGDAASAVEALTAGLACDQEIPALAGDMRRLLAEITSALDEKAPMSRAEEIGGAVPLQLSAYGKAQP